MGWFSFVSRKKVSDVNAKQIEALKQMQCDVIVNYNWYFKQLEIDYRETVIATEDAMSRRDREEVDTLMLKRRKIWDLLEATRVFYNSRNEFYEQQIRLFQTTREIMVQDPYETRTDPPDK